MSDTPKTWSIYSLPNGSSGVIGEETTPLVKVVEYSAYDRIKCVLERLEINFKMVQEALKETKAELEHCSNAHQEVGVFWAEAEDKLKAEKAKSAKLYQALKQFSEAMNSGWMYILWNENKSLHPDWPKDKVEKLVHAAIVNAGKILTEITVEK